jgi:hypothetical protein
MASFGWRGQVMLTDYTTSAQSITNYVLLGIIGAFKNKQEKQNE